LVKFGGKGRPVVGEFKIPNPPVKIEWGRNMDLSFGDRRIEISPDGSFRLDDVDPGTYRMVANIYDPRDPNARGNGRYIAKYAGKFDVPARSRDGRATLDLGAVDLGVAP
jgi:hypothetical protein